MKNYLAVVVMLFSPSLIVFIEANTFNIFDVKGKLFLLYYITLICTSIFALQIVKKQATLSLIICGIVVIIGVVKTIVGTYRNKPVGFLILLIIIYFIIYSILKNKKLFQ